MEIWKDIKGYEGLYQVSNLGRVKSLDRYVTYINGNVKKHKGIILKQSYNIDGYCVVGLYKDSKSKQHRVNRLVADAFIPNPDNLPIVRHYPDANLKNNNVSNLRWGTNDDNSKDMVFQNRQAKGESVGTSTTKEEQVLQILNYIELGFRNFEISKLTGISKYIIYRVKKGISWNWITKIK